MVIDTGAARLGAMVDGMRARMLQRRVDRLEEDRARLRTENAMLAGELEAERSERYEIEEGGGFRPMRLLFWAGLGYGAWTMYRNRRPQVQRAIGQARQQGERVLRLVSGKAQVAAEEARNLGREAAEEVDEFSSEVRESTRRVMEAGPQSTGTTSTTSTGRTGTTGTGTTGTGPARPMPPTGTTGR